MARSLSSMYGADDNDFAESIASDALDPSGAINDPYMWGPLDDARAQSQANVGKESLGPSDPKTPVTKNKSQSVDYPTDASGSHKKGPSTSTDTGGRKSLVPSNQKASQGKQKSPAYANETS